MAEDERTTPWVALPPGEHLDWEHGHGPCPTPYMARVTWRFADGTATPVGVEVRSAHGQPVTAVAWRAVPVAQLIDLTRKALRGWAIGSYLAAHYQQDDEAAAQAVEVEQALTPPRKRGRPPLYGEQHYRRVAEVYTAALAASDPKPVRAVAAEFGITDPDDYRPKGWVRTAQRRGLITDRKDDRG